MTKDEIVLEIRRRCRILGVTFDLRKGSMVQLAPGMKCSGFFDAFDERGPRLVCASKLDTEAFLGVLIHEYCHVTQWVENCTIWQQDMWWAERFNTDEWLNSGRRCTENMRKTFATRRDMEADNERRAVRMIKEFKAPIDIGRYIQRANSYIHFYNTMPVTNRWYHKDRVPYRMPNVTALFRSDKIEDDFSRTPKKKFAALVKCADH